jgi:DNA polymerase
MTLQAADLSRPQLEALLRWYAEAGVDLAVDGLPHDRFAEFAAEAQRRAAAPAQLASVQTSSPQTLQAPQAARAPLAAPRPLAPAALNAGEAAEAARLAAEGATSLEALQAALEAFEGCALKRTATSLVFGEGPADARLMLVGEAPGADDDREGRPFSGAGGRLLARMLAAIGRTRESVRLAHLSPWRPPGNRKLTPQEGAACLPFVRRQIELVAPDVIVCLGDGAAQALLDVREGVVRARGKPRDFTLPGAQARTIPALVMLSPEFLLRQPLYKRQTWADLRALRRTLDALAPRG